MFAKDNRNINEFLHLLSGVKAEVGFALPAYPSHSHVKFRPSWVISQLSSKRHVPRGAQGSFLVQIDESLRSQESPE